MIHVETAIEIARRTLLDCGGDRDAAFQRLMRKINKNSSFEKLLRNELPIETVIREFINRAGMNIRQQVKRMANADPNNLTVGQMMSLAYYWPLPNGKPIGKATRQDIDDAIEFHRTRASSHGHSVTFYRKIKEHLDNDSDLVEDVLTAEALLELKAEAG